MNRGGLLDEDYVRRGLGRHRRLRLACAVLWSSFLGASLATTALYLIPRDLTLPPPSAAGAGWAFFAIWLLVLVPSAFAAVLALPPGKDG
jgi:hypothetical protein